MAEKASYSARPHLRDPSFCSLAQNLRMKPKKNEKKIAGLGFPLTRLNYTFLTVRAQQSSAQKKYDLHFNFWTFLHLLLYKVFFLTLSVCPWCQIKNRFLKIRPTFQSHKTDILS